MEYLITQILNSVGYGLLLFLLAAGLTLIFSMMGVLNFAHASFYMLGAYLAFQISEWLGFWVALWLAPLVVGLAGAALEHWGLRRVHAWGHVPELLFTFGLSYVLLEVVQLVWGRAPLAYRVPAELDGPAGWLLEAGITFPMYRLFAMAVAIAVLGGLWLLLSRTRVGLVVQAALSHPQMVEALGHNVPRVMLWVFAGGCALAGLAGVIGGNLFVTEPAMAGTVGAILFVVIVVGGMGSLAGAFVASLLIGFIETFGKASDASLAGLIQSLGGAVGPDTPGWFLLKLTLAQAAPVLPYLLMVVMLILRPRGLMGSRED